MSEAIRFSEFIETAIMSPRKEIGAAMGFCPQCGLQALREVYRGGGYWFQQCEGCKGIAVLEDKP